MIEEPKILFAWKSLKFNIVCLHHPNSLRGTTRFIWEGRNIKTRYWKYLAWVSRSVLAGDFGLLCITMSSQCPWNVGGEMPIWQMESACFKLQFVSAEPSRFLVALSGLTLWVSRVEAPLQVPRGPVVSWGAVGGAPLLDKDFWCSVPLAALLDKSLKYASCAHLNILC